MDTNHSQNNSNDDERILKYELGCSTVYILLILYLLITLWQAIDKIVKAFCPIC